MYVRFMEGGGIVARASSSQQEWYRELYKTDIIHSLSMVLYMSQESPLQKPLSKTVLQIDNLN